MLKKRSIARFDVLSLAIWTSACSGPMVRTQYNHSAHFDGIHTYSWSTAEGAIGEPIPHDPPLDRRIRSAIDGTLQTKGYRLVSPKDADVLLAYFVSSEKKVDARLENYGVAELMDMTYILGRLDLIMTRGLPPVEIWKGSVHAHIDMSRPLEERDKKLREAAHALLEKFPPK